MQNLKEELKNWLPRDRFEHSLRVEKAALKLAEHFGVDRKKASTAALLHDCGRYVEGKKLIAKAKKLGLKVSEIEAFQPKLLHARLGAETAKRVFKIKDKEVLLAISRHTVGASGMTALEKIIYLADHIESGRRYGKVNRVRRFAFSDLDKAIVESTSSMIADLIKKGLPVAEQTIRTRNYFLGVMHDG